MQSNRHTCSSAERRKETFSSEPNSSRGSVLQCQPKPRGSSSSEVLVVAGGRCGLPRLKPAEDVELDEELFVSLLLCAALLTRSLWEERGTTKTGP